MADLEKRSEFLQRGFLEFKKFGSPKHYFGLACLECPYFGEENCGYTRHSDENSAGRLVHDLISIRHDGTLRDPRIVNFGNVIGQEDLVVPCQVAMLGILKSKQYVPVPQGPKPPPTSNRHYFDRMMAAAGERPSDYDIE